MRFTERRFTHSDIRTLLSVCAVTFLLSACGGSTGDGGLSEALKDTESPGAVSPTSSEDDDASGLASDLPDAVPVFSPDVDVKPIDTDKNTAPAPIDPDISQGAELPVNDELPFIAPVFTPMAHDIIESQAHYSVQGYGTVNVVRMDIRTETTQGICESSDKSGCTLADVMADTDKGDDLTVTIPVHLTGDDFPDDGLVTNAELQQRGGTTRQAPQKSLKIKIDNKDAVWRDERSILFNKHPFENDRIRNKLAFDLMSEIPHLSSFRTQFINLWIDDGQGPVDYGLFTHVESPGNRYLRRRGLDDTGRLYKVNRFNFSQSDLRAVAVDAEGSPVDKDRFEERLEIESGKDHTPLVNMLTDLHDPAQSFESVLARYFNDNNVLTWLTVNLLLNQTDAISQNYLLYNPAGSERFYFLPWDYDGAFSVEPEPPSGISNEALQKRLFYGYARAIHNDFITQYYQRPDAHQRFVEAAGVIRQNWLTDERINELALEYGELVKPWLTRLPDSAHNPSFNEFSVGTYAGFIAQNEEALSTRFHMPMPPMIQEDPVLLDDYWVFKWTPAYDLTGRALTYEFQISSTPQFEARNLLARLLDIRPVDTTSLVSVQVPANRIDSGRKYVRVIVRPDQQPERFWQVSANRVMVDGVYWSGAMAFDP